MGISSLGNILKIFGNTEPSAVDQHALFHEAVLVTLARATSVDTNIHPLEVDTVQKVVQRVTGADISDAEIRVAAKSELFRKNSLGASLKKVAPKLKREHLVGIVKALEEVIKSDVRVSPWEVEYFDNVANALGVKHSELVGLIADPS